MSGKGHIEQMEDQNYGAWKSKDGRSNNQNIREARQDLSSKSNGKNGSDIREVCSDRIRTEQNISGTPCIAFVLKPALNR